MTTKKTRKNHTSWIFDDIETYILNAKTSIEKNDVSGISQYVNTSITLWENYE